MIHFTCPGFRSYVFVSDRQTDRQTDGQTPCVCVCVYVCVCVCVHAHECNAFLCSLQAYYFALCDIHARGYMRQFCMTFVSPDRE